VTSIPPVCDSNTSRVARSNNSTGYFLALGMTDLSFRQANPGNEVSVKTGMAHVWFAMTVEWGWAAGIAFVFAGGVAAEDGWGDPRGTTHPASWP
jgi:hypothetical protein